MKSPRRLSTEGSGMRLNCISVKEALVLLEFEPSLE